MFSLDNLVSWKLSINMCFPVQEILDVFDPVHLSMPCFDSRSSPNMVLDASTSLLIKKKKKMTIHGRNSDFSIIMLQKSRFLIYKLHSCNYRIFCQNSMITCFIFIF